MKMDFYKFFGCLNYLNYILWLLELNVVILLLNLPLMFVVFIAGIRLGTLPVIFVAGITIGPSILAAFGSMPHIEDGVVRFYFRNLAGKWKQCLKIWIPAWFVMIVLIADIDILHIYGVMEPLKWGMVLLLFAETVFLLSFFIVWAQWGQRVKDAAVLTLKLSFVKPFRFHLGLLILSGTIVLLSMKTIYLLLYGASLGLFLVYKNFCPVIQYVNDRPENSVSRAK